MKSLRGFLILLLMLMPRLIFPQNDTIFSGIDEIIEKISPAESELISGYQYMEDLAKHPVDLNKADIWELQSIPGVDRTIAEKIISYRKAYGSYFSKSELFLIKDLPGGIVSGIIPFVCVLPKPENSFNKKQNEDSGTPRFLELRGRVMKSSQDNEAINKYPGNSLKIYNRLHLEYENISGGILTEKDPGEVSGYDFYSYFLSAENLPFLKNVIVGDYSLKLGQGLIASTPYSIMKSSEAILQLSRNKSTALPYTSVSEISFFRGTAVSVNIFPGELLLFYSQKKIDAVTDTAGFITSFSSAGYHRTMTEIERKGNTNISSYGGGIRFELKESLRIRLFHLGTLISRKLNIPGHQDDNFSFTSISYDLSFKELSIYGETAYDGERAASLNHLFFLVDKNLSIMNSFRWYPGFLSLYGNSFSERDGILKNETGFYTGINYRSHAGVFNVYFDLFNLNPQGFSLQGRELFFGYNIRLAPVEMQFSYRNKLKEKLSTALHTGKELTENYSFGLIYNLNKKLRIKTRLQYKHFYSSTDGFNSEGYLFYTDTQYQLNDLKIYGRIIFFDTGSFDSAVYEYENNVPGVFQNQALYNSGFRWYFLIKYNLFNLCTLSLKYSETYRTAPDFEPPSNLNQLVLQADIQF